MNTTISTEILVALDATQPAPTRGIVTVLREWIASTSVDRRTRYLSQAADHGDLERRMRAWDDSERVGF